MKQSDPLTNNNLILYGIANCDTVKKAKKWLTQQGIDFTFHDFKTSGIPNALPDWTDTFGWENLLKKSGTTWRNLDESEKCDLYREKALSLMQQHYNLIKRPVLVSHNQVLLTGFKESEWESILRNHLLSEDYLTPCQA